MTFQDAVAFLDTWTNFERTRQRRAMRQIQPGRMARLCQLLGDPQRRFRSIVVAGTNGKGSISAMIYSMLRESSLRAGLYTSPHLEHVRERIRSWTAAPAQGARRHGDDWIGEEEFAALVSEMQPVLETMRAQDAEHAPTYFEVLTALAYLAFARRGVEIAVLEVGLGGRLDATNVVQQAVSVFGPIDVDHTDVLGPDPVSIAREKAGIIKPHQMAISVPQPPEVLEVLQQACDAQGVPLLVVGRELTAAVQRHALEGLTVSLTGLRGWYEALDLPLLGRHQADNAAAAVGAIEALAFTGVPYGMVERGLAAVEWPGRLEVVHERPLVLMDGAHNPHAAEALAHALKELCPGRKIHLLVGMSADKSAEAFGQRIGPLASSITCTKSHHPRALGAATLAKRLKTFCAEVHVMSDPVDAYTYAINTVGDDDVVVVTGSLFLVGELRSAIRSSHVRPRRPLAATPQENA